MHRQHKEEAAFQKVYTAGISIGPDDLAATRMFDKNSLPLFYLVLGWRNWIKCASLAEVHRWLQAIIREERTCNRKAFEKLCGCIGFRRRGRGRPAGLK